MPVNISRMTINAPVEKVWDALTKPELVKKWQFGSELKTDWIPGNEIRFTTPWEGNVFEQWGKIIEIKTLELIRYSLFAPRPNLEDKPENYFVMTYKLIADGEQTKLEIAQEDHRPHAKQEDEQGEENPVLQLLKKTAEAI